MYAKLISLTLGMVVMMGGVLEAAKNGRICNNPRCGMCNRLEAQYLAKQRGSWARSYLQYQAVHPTARKEPTGYRYETRAVQVPKTIRYGCSSGVCQYRTVMTTEYRQVKVPVTTNSEPKNDPVKKVNLPSQKGTATSEVQFELDPIDPEIMYIALSYLQPRKHSTLYDLGSGDGRVVLSAVDIYGCKAVGIEINSESHNKAVSKLRSKDLKGVRLMRGDATRYALDGATHVFMYLYPDTMEQLKLDTVKPGTKLLSYQHDIPGVTTIPIKLRHDGVDHQFYYHMVPPEEPDCIDCKQAKCNRCSEPTLTVVPTIR